MSSPSKKRAARREWMHKQASECNRLIAASRNDCTRRIEALTRHVPESKDVYRPDGKMDRISFIEQFPKPRETGEFHRYVLHDPPAPMFGTPPYRGRFDTIDFRATYHAIKRSGPNGDAVLKWVTWEPTVDKKDRSEHKALRKLQLAAAIITSEAYYTPRLIEPLGLLRECTEALESSLGELTR